MASMKALNDAMAVEDALRYFTGSCQLIGFHRMVECPMFDSSLHYLQPSWRLMAPRVAEVGVVRRYYTLSVKW